MGTPSISVAPSKIHVDSKNRNGSFSKFNIHTTINKLDYSITSKKGETRQQHISLHNTNNLQKMHHGVFYGDPIAVTNAASANRGGVEPIRNGSTDMYVIPSQNSGYDGGYAGQGTNLNYMTIIVQAGSK